MRSLSLLFLLLPLFFLHGCASMYFEAAAPPDNAVRIRLPDLEQKDYWTGIVFNGNKIGFSHTKISPAGEGLWKIVSETALAFHFLTFEKSVVLHGTDIIDEHLLLKRFTYDYTLDDHFFTVNGEVLGDTLLYEMTSSGGRTRQSRKLTEPLLPMSAVNLAPVLRGLAVGRDYSFLVFNGEMQTVDRIRQSVAAYETSELFEGKAYRVRTEILHEGANGDGRAVKVWIDELGMPKLEMTEDNIFLSYLEEEAMARRYLAEAMLNKKDVFIDYSLIKTVRQINDPRSVKRMQIALSGPAALTVPESPYQHCEQGVVSLLCTMTASGAEDVPPTELGKEERQAYLQSNPVISTFNDRIRAIADEIGASAEGDRKRIGAILAWITKNIEKKPVDVFSSVDVLDAGGAECQGHSYLYASLARALAIPTKVVNGIVYSENMKGFLFHTWNESFVDGGWLSVDPIFNQQEADATHVKLLEGEEMRSLVGLAELVGKLAIEVVEFE